MTHKNFTNNIIFRILVPPIYGSFVYVLILLFFNSLNRLYENFFSAEVFLCVFIAYFLSEFMRLLLKNVNRFCPKDCSISIRLTIQFALATILSLIITSSIVSSYYKFLVGFSKFTTELVIFNAIYLVSIYFYNLLYFSIYYLNKLNEIKVQHENKARQNVENELTAYKNRINPDFLFKCFETIISLCYKNQKQTDDFVNTLSKVYRYILSHKKTQLVTIEEELNVCIEMIKLQNFSYSEAIELKSEITEDCLKKRIIPGTLLFIIEYVLKSTIVSNIQPLQIKISNNSNEISISHLQFKKVIPPDKPVKELNNINKAYHFFNKDGLKLSLKNEYVTYTLPIIETFEIENEYINN